ncbi:hypothetical protein IHN32_17180, partial [Deinococcus sp. 14RED07]|uniref:hypothetical protein n=1 Tax=Deinococcus sp. 14RED07 TaxID=2745874 RepID=UPI001E655624
ALGGGQGRQEEAAQAGSQQGETGKVHMYSIICTHSDRCHFQDEQAKLFLRQTHLLAFTE